MKSKREKLLEKWTFETFLPFARAKEAERGLLHRGDVLKLQVLFAEKAGKCVLCGSTENLETDHIFPSFFLKSLGYPAGQMFKEEWYQCLCKPCNMQKSYRVDWEHPNTYLILKKVMEEKPTWEYHVLQKEETKQQAERRKHTDKYGA